MPHRRPAALAAALVVLVSGFTACSTVGTAPPAAEIRLTDALGAARPLSSTGDRANPRGDTGLYFETFSHPLVRISPDEDEDEPAGGFDLEADLRTGDGLGVAAGVQADGLGVGLLYLTSEHTERQTDVPATFHGAFVEAQATGRHDLGWAEGSLTLGLGVGAGGIDFDDLLRDSGGTAVEGRLSAGLRLRHVGLELGGGFFSWGVPGETIGNGMYVAAGITLWF